MSRPLSSKPLPCRNCGMPVVWCAPSERWAHVKVGVWPLVEACSVDPVTFKTIGRKRAIPGVAR